ncbi:MAG: type II toxin-antitoxin system Phd/YefM family antitoxin [Sphingomonadaceae bacterium]
MTIVGVHEAKTHLSRLIERVLGGEEIVIARNREPVVRLVRAGPPEKKPLLGAFRGQFELKEDFFDPLPEEELNAWFDGKP